MVVQPSSLMCLCVTALALTGCSAPQTAEPIPAPSAPKAGVPAVVVGVVCDRFEPKVVLAGDEMVLSLDTDLPDQTDLMVSVSRSYFEGSPEQEYPLQYLSDSSTVGAWRTPHRVSVAHAVWAKLLDERARLSASIGDSFKVIRTKSDVEASFTVPINQSDPRFGKDNEHLTGTKVSGRNVRVEKAVAFPLSAKGTVPARNYAPREALRQGLTYQIPKEFPLMPYRRSEHPLEDIQNVRRLPAQTRVTILTVDHSQATNPWYQVKAVSPTGEDLGDGWINSIALIGGDITQVQQ